LRFCFIFSAASIMPSRQVIYRPDVIVRFIPSGLIITFLFALLLFFLCPASFAGPGADKSARLSDPAFRRHLVQNSARNFRDRQNFAWTQARRHGWPTKGPRDGGGFELMAMEDNNIYIYLTQNANAAISIADDLVRNTPPYNIDGGSQRVAIWDQGAVRSTHQEFVGRVTVKDEATIAPHSTHVGGTIGAAGVVPGAMGMAPGVFIDSYDWNTDLSEMTNRAMSYAGEPNNIQLSNHSYGIASGWENGYWSGSYGKHWFGAWGLGYRESNYFGCYLSDTADWDSLCYDAPYYLPFNAVGNDRDDVHPSTGTTFYYFYNGFWLSKTYDPNQDPYSDGWDNGGYDTILPVASGKNIITVGAVYDAVTDGTRDLSKATMAGFSGWGPTDDGRIKPDIVTNGITVYSTESGSDTSYGSRSGTSHASPGACGAAALLLDYYHELFPGQYLRASTIKGLIIHTADDLANSGPDYKFGWGLINTQAAADHIRDHHDYPQMKKIVENYLEKHTTSRTFNFTYGGSGPIRATLCWTDPAGTATTALDSTTPRLVRDLDLRIIGPEGSPTTYYPFVLDPANPANLATTGDNVRDNVEQVYVNSSVPSGTYSVVVSTKSSIPTGVQQYYSLLLTGSIYTNPPPAPAEVQVLSLPDCGQVRLSWQPSNGADGYYIYYQEDSPGPPFDPNQDGSPASGSDVDDANEVIITSLDPSQTYYFAVTAYNDQGEGDYSDQPSVLVGENCSNIISGYLLTQSDFAVPGVEVSADNGGDGSVTEPNGFYQLSVPFGWTGTITPEMDNWRFEPNARTYVLPVITEQQDQDFLGIASADFDNTSPVDLYDLMFFAAHWLDPNCADSDWCDRCDLDLSGGVDNTDMSLFAEQWQQD